VISSSSKILHISLCTYGSVTNQQLIERAKEHWAKKLTKKNAKFSDYTFRRVEMDGVVIYSCKKLHRTPIYKVFSSKCIKIENKITKCKV
jgi:hypothetical protein